MEAQLRERLDSGQSVTFQRSMDAHLLGQSWETPFVPVPDGTIDAGAVEAMVRAFHDTYEGRSGNRFEMLPVQGATFRVRAVLDTPKVSYPELPGRGDEPLTPDRTVTLHYLGDLADGEGAKQASVYDRGALRAGDVIDGPAIVDEGLSTTHVGVGKRATVGRYGELIIRRA
jgi:N-methylhydantoinase A